MQCKKIWSTNVKNGDVTVQTGDSNDRIIRGEQKVNYIAIETSHFSRSRHTTLSDCAFYLPHMPYLYTAIVGYSQHQCLIDSITLQMRYIYREKCNKKTSMTTLEKNDKLTTYPEQLTCLAGTILRDGI